MISVHLRYCEKASRVGRSIAFPEIECASVTAPLGFPATHILKKKLSDDISLISLVGGLNPSEKYESQLG